MAFLSNMIRQGGKHEVLSIDTAKPDYYEITIQMAPDIYENWLCGIFTKTICEAKNRNQLMKAVAMAEELGLKEGEDFFLIKDNCLTELEPEEIGEDGIVSPRTCPDCPMMDTVWAALVLRKIPYEDLTEKQKEAVQRIKAEPKSMEVS